MKTHAKLALGFLAGALALASTSAAEYQPLKLDAGRSRIGFTASTLVFSVDGMFKKYEILVDGDPSNYPAAKLRVNIDAASIFTANSTRDGHLSSPDFFDVKRYPRITFVSKQITPTASGIDMRGTLEIRGKSKQVTVPFQISHEKDAGVDVIAYEGRLTIDRNDWGVGSDSVAAKISLLDEVTVHLVVVVFP